MRPHLVEWLAQWIGWEYADLLAPGYFTMAGIACVVASWLVMRAARRAGDDTRAIADAILWGYVGTLVGGIVFPMILDVAGQALSGRIPVVRWAGMVAYGGFFGGFGAALLVLRRRKTVAPWRFADLVAAPLGVAICIVRVGCFVAGCDYGEVTDAALAVRFPPSSPAFHDHVHAGWLPASRTGSLPVHPTQLYEAALGLGIFAGATWLGARLAARRAAQGLLFLCVAAAYAVGRSSIELLRGDVSRGVFGGVSTSQLISAIVVAFIVYTLVRRRRELLPVAAALAVLLVATGARAQTDPVNPYGQPAPPPPQQPPPQPYPAAPQPYPYGPPPGSQPPPAPEPVDKPKAPEKPIARPHYVIQATLSLTSALNRPEGQVPPLSGGSLTFRYQKQKVGFGAQLEGTSSTVAQHTTFSAFTSLTAPVSPRLDFVGRFGLGFTQILFRDPSFRDLFGTNFRLGSAFEWSLSPELAIFIEPLVLDLVTARDLGGPIFSFQLGFGARYGWR